MSQIFKQEPCLISAKASAVNYHTDGIYTTKITVENEGFAELTTDDIKVTYTIIDFERYNTALKEAGDKTNIDVKSFFTNMQAKVTKVSVADASTMTVSFIDDRAAENFTSKYSVYIESKKIEAVVDVEFTKFTLTPEAEYVLASDKDISLTLVLDKGEFAKDISKEKISLGGSFKEMKIESLSSNGRNLTMQLTGEHVIHESSGVYLDGFVNVAPSGIVNANSVTRARVFVQTKSAYFISDKITVSGSKVKIPLVLIGVADLDSLTKDSFAFESGVEVTDCTKCSNNQVALTMTVDGASDKNSAAAALNGQTVKINNDFELAMHFISAFLDPVFDHVEQNGNDLKITLKLNVHSGTFADGLTKEMFSFGHDFKDASVISVEKTGDTTAELIISVPANGKTDGTMDIAGDVIVAAGALINIWGEATGSETESLCIFSLGSMGRVANDICADESSDDYAKRIQELIDQLSEKNVDELVEAIGKVGFVYPKESILDRIKEYGKTTTDKILDSASKIKSGAMVVKSFLEMTGIIESDSAKIERELGEISKSLELIKIALDKNTELLNELKIEISQVTLNTFDNEVIKLKQRCNMVSCFFKNGTDLVKKQGIKQPAKEASEEEWIKYNQKLIEEMKFEEKNGNAQFEDFSNWCFELEKQFNDVAGVFVKEDNNNPLYLFDKNCSLIYNFDSSSYKMREAYRENIANTLNNALAYLLLYRYSNIQICNQHNDSYKIAMDYIDKHAVKESDNIYIYLIETTVNKKKVSTTYSSDYAFPNSKRNFSDSERNEFITRMNHRTLREEMKLAGIEMGNDKESVGFTFSWRCKKDQHYMSSSTDYYAQTIKWDEIDMKEIHTFSSECDFNPYGPSYVDNKNLCKVRIWG